MYSIGSLLKATGLKSVANCWFTRYDIFNEIVNILLSCLVPYCRAFISFWRLRDDHGIAHCCHQDVQRLDISISYWQLMRARARLKIFNGWETHIIVEDNISFFRQGRASIKSFGKTPDVIFHLITNILGCQWTRVAQVRIRGSAHESCDRGSVLAQPSSKIQRWALQPVQQIHFAPGSNENRHDSRVPHGGVVQRRLLITIQSVDVATCHD